MTGHKRVTLQMIAEAVGVAAGTVSAVLNRHKGSMRYSAATAARVCAAAKKLHYEPNLQARGVLQGKSFLLGIIFNSQFWRIVERIIPAIRSVCYDSDYELLLYPSDTPEMELKNLQMARRRSVDGILLLPVSSLDKNLQEFLEFAASGRPVIQFLYRITPQLPFVGRNFSTLCKQGIDYFLDNGISHPGLIVSSNYEDEKEGGASYSLAKAYIREMTLRGLKPSILPLSSTKLSAFHSGMKSALRLASEPFFKRGWLVSSCAMAYGITYGLRQMGENRQPFFISCSDDLELPAELLPPLPYFPVPYEKVGRLATQWALNGAPAADATSIISSTFNKQRKGKEK